MHALIAKCSKDNTFILMLIQHHHGRPPASDMWVFGSPCRDTWRCQHEIPTLSYPLSRTMLRQEQLSTRMNGGHIILGSNLPSVASHGSVNHSITFVNPTTGVHTPNIESYLERVKLKFKCLKGCHAHQISSYLDEFMWRERHAPCTTEMAFDSIMRDITQQYTV